MRICFVLLMAYFFSACTGYEAFQDPEKPGEFVIEEVEYIDETLEHIKAEKESNSETESSIFFHDGKVLVNEKAFLQNLVPSPTTTTNVEAHPNGVIEFRVKAIIYPCNFSIKTSNNCFGQGKINETKNKLVKTFKGFKTAIEEGSNGMFRVLFSESDIQVNMRMIQQSNYNVSGPPHNWHTLNTDTTKKLVAEDFKGKKTANFAILMQDKNLSTANFTMFDLGLITFPGPSSDGVAVHEFYHYIDFRLASAGEEGKAHADTLGRNIDKEFMYPCVNTPGTFKVKSNGQLEWDWRQQQFVENILSNHEACDGRKLNYCDIKGTFGKFIGDRCSQGILLNPTTFGNEGPTPVPAKALGKWKKVNGGNIPSDAFVAGHYKGQDQYICRANQSGGVHPGRVVNGQCHYAFGGSTVTKSTFEVLVGNDYEWFSEKRPGDAIPSGKEANGSVISSCQAKHDGGTLPGKSGGSRKCSIGLEKGQQVVHSEVHTKFLIPRRSGSTPPSNNPPPTPPSSEGWQAVTGGNIPSNAFAAGAENGKTQYVCRFNLNGGVHSGRFVDGQCRVGWGGQAHLRNDFEVLVGNYKWVSGSSRPSNAVVGGQESNGGKLYVCRTNHDGGTHPGKSSGDTCMIAYDGKEQYLNVDNYLVPASGSNPAPPSSEGWQSTNGSIPSNAFKSGNHAGKDLYVCRANLNGGVHPGRAFDGKCHIGWGGQEHIKTQFEVLVGSFKWKNGSKPNDAVVGGNEASGSTIYVCRAKLDGSKQPGKTGGNGICAIGFEGQEHNQGSAQYLVPNSGSSNPSPSEPNEPCRQIVFGVCIK